MVRKSYTKEELEWFDGDKKRHETRTQTTIMLGGIEKEDPAVARCLEVLRQK